MAYDFREKCFQTKSNVKMATTNSAAFKATARIVTYTEIAPVVVKVMAMPIASIKTQNMATHFKCQLDCCTHCGTHR
jgi:hypothetical protein